MARRPATKKAAPKQPAPKKTAARKAAPKKPAPKKAPAAKKSAPVKKAAAAKKRAPAKSSAPPKQPAAPVERRLVSKRPARAATARSVSRAPEPAPEAVVPDILHVGIDLGTARSAVAASNGERHWIDSYVGWPKDFVARKMLGQRVLFGADALDNRLALDLCRPLEQGVIREGTHRDEESIKELVKHLIELADPQPGQAIHAAIGIPAEALRVNRAAIKDAVGDLAAHLMVVSEPFAVAYGMGALNNALIIDIGAGTVDFCIMHGTVPSDEDQRSMVTAGDFVDQRLLQLLQEAYPEASFTLDLARHLKERHAFVGEPEGRIVAEVPVAGRVMDLEISEPMRRACESILPGIVETAVEMIANFDPEYQDRVRNNIVVAGGGSQIRGIENYVADALSEYGPCTVSVVEDPLFGGCIGALGLAEEMPEEYWEES